MRAVGPTFHCLHCAAVFLVLLCVQVTLANDEVACVQKTALRKCFYLRVIWTRLFDRNWSLPDFSEIVVPMHMNCNVCFMEHVATETNLMYFNSLVT